MMRRLPGIGLLLSEIFDPRLPELRTTPSMTMGSPVVLPACEVPGLPILMPRTVAAE